jgi:hypothetical protein
MSLFQFGGGYGAPPNTRTQDFHLLMGQNNFITIHAALTRAAGGGDAAIGIIEFVDVRGNTQTAANEADWFPIAASRSGRFTVAAMALGAAMTGSVRIQLWED